jgi:hypothetical protein
LIVDVGNAIVARERALVGRVIGSSAATARLRVFADV